LMSASYGRDPRELLERYRRETQEGGLDYWATGAASTLADFAEPKARIDAILFGDCDVHMEAGFLKREAGRRGIDLRVAATFPDDPSFAAEHTHDVILVGALRSRHAIAEPPQGRAPHEYLGADPDRQPARADRAAARHGRAGDRRPPQPLPPRQPQPCRARRTVRRRARGGCGGGAGGGGIRAHA